MAVDQFQLLKMATFIMLRNTICCLKSAHINWSKPALSTCAARYGDDVATALKTKEAPQKDSRSAVMNAEEISHKIQHEGYITVDQPMNISTISGVPEEHIKNRLVRIYKPSKNAMQSGTDNIGHWQIDFETRERWENPLIGWTSTGDPLSNMKVEFSSQNDAIAYCEKNGWKWFLQLDTPKAPKVKPYGLNFSWNKKTRVSTK